MSMRADFEKVMQARKSMRAAKTLPERFYQVLCYQGATLAFFEKYRQKISSMIPPEADHRWTI